MAKQQKQQNEEREVSMDELKMQQQKKRMKITIIIMAIIIVVAVGVTIWALFFKDKKDYPEKRIEPNAIATDDGSDKMDQPEGGGAISLSYTDAVTISLSKKEATLSFTNPSKSNQDMVLQIVIEDTVVAESGRIQPGNKVETLSDVNTDILSAGTYDGVFSLNYYNADSAEQAIVSTEMPITITVTE